MKRVDTQQESLSIPTNVRSEVDVRDRMVCRVCGRFLGERRALHHVMFGGGPAGPGIGGRRTHEADLIVTVCWQPGDGDCHELVHSNKAYFQDLLLEVLRRPGITVFQVERWRARRRLRDVDS